METKRPLEVTWNEAELLLIITGLERTTSKKEDIAELEEKLLALGVHGDVAKLKIRVLQKLLTMHELIEGPPCACSAHVIRPDEVKTSVGVSTR